MVEDYIIHHFIERAAELPPFQVRTRLIKGLPSEILPVSSLEPNKSENALTRQNIAHIGKFASRLPISTISLQVSSNWYQVCHMGRGVQHRGCMVHLPWAHAGRIGINQVGLDMRSLSMNTMRFLRSAIAATDEELEAAGRLKRCSAHVKHVRRPELLGQRNTVPSQLSAIHLDSCECNENCGEDGFSLGSLFVEPMLYFISLGGGSSVDSSARMFSQCQGKHRGSCVATLPMIMLVCDFW